ncbi:dipicolinate synthase subunit DpsA [Salibacterium aidingense]|uniref:dipicolinate synthase subunit DpsA n=1 Tax=Salibacterium aidingense TaxID=384933 RepID=UPI0003F6AF2A|nr:dipicolinate synthase subunit DpsA [Salibacterium aidingense]
MKGNIVLIGGDARQIEMADYLQQKGMEVTLLGFDRWCSLRPGMKKAAGKADVDWETLDAVILPVSGIKPEQKVEAVFSENTLYVEESWFHRLKPECLIITGIRTEAADKLMTRINRSYTALMERNDTAIYNSVPTAEGVLLMAIQETEHTIHQSRTLVLGFGRTGQTIAGTFSAVGAYAKVGTSDPAETARAEAMGHDVFDLSRLNQAVSLADICINTIPSLILSENILIQVPAHTLIIDIASSPGGTDFEYAEKRGIRALQAPGLPGVTAPKTAGHILGKVILQLLKENDGKKEA